MQIIGTTPQELLNVADLVRGRDFSFDTETRHGYCKCGCGEKTELHDRNDARKGHVAGQPKDYIYNHHRRKHPLACFFENIQVNEETGCFDWTGTCFKFSGRPRWIWLFPINGVTEVLASRAAYRLFLGDIPDGMLVCHTCDRPICVNPHHFFLGTPKDNIVDASLKGRLSSGASNRESQGENVKLHRDAVIDILTSDSSHARLAAKYGVSKSAIYLARRGETWKDVYNDVMPHKL